MLILFLFVLTQIEGKEVCSLSFNYGLNSLFIEKDAPLQVAQDEVHLCHLCAQITRLGYLYANLPQTRYQWTATLSNNACDNSLQSRLSDCQKLTKAIIDAQEDYFTGDQAHFTDDELELTRVELTNVLEQKSVTLCTNMRCCHPKKKKNPKADTDTDEALEPLQQYATLPDSGEVRNDLRNLNNQRLTLQKEKDALDKLKAALQSAKLKLADEQHKADKHEEDLETREDALDKEKTTFAKDVEKNRTYYQAKEKDLQQWEKELEKIDQELEKEEEKRKAEAAAAAAAAAVVTPVKVTDVTQASTTTTTTPSPKAL